jgi:hypothetical protein
VIGFLGLEWSAEELRRAIDANRAGEVRAGGGTAIPVGGQSSSPQGTVVEPDGFVRHAPPGGWKRDLSWSERLLTRRFLGHPMREFGYGGRAAGGHARGA